jgi:hypothetical protein
VVFFSVIFCGFPVFDKEETILFDELTGEFGGATIDKARSGAFIEFLLNVVGKERRSDIENAGTTNASRS